MEEYDFENKSEQELLLSFKSNKGHRTRQFNKITNLLTLQEQKYSKTTEKTILAAVQTMEKYQGRLTLLASYLSLHTLESAGVHVTEAKTLATATEEQSQKVMTQVYEHEPDDTELIQALQLGQGVQGQSGVKQVMALKPDKLRFDANLFTVRRWKQRFRAFHASSNLRALPFTDQQAFLIACIDNEVASRINRLVSETPPMFPMIS